MVYCGKPSKACAECRLRRTKARYRTEADMMFRDQTQYYTKRRRTENQSRLLVSKRGSKASNDTSDALIDPQLTCQSTMQLAMQITPLVLELSTSSAEQATCYFFRNYVLEDNSTSGSFQYLHEIYDNELIGPALTDSIESLGMVGLANFWKASEFQFHANKKYNSALRLVSSRLRNENEARADQTLVAVILLGLFEINTCTGPQSMRSWTKHIIGASSLLQLKGKQCLETPTGRHIFAHLRTQIITNCIQRHVSIPPFIRDWSTYALHFQSPNDAHATTLAEQVMEFCDLRATMSSFHDYRNAEKIIKSALVIDSKLAEWAFTYPPECMFYKTLTLRQRSDRVFSDHYHIYDSIWAAALWNHYRCVRILINEVVYVQLTHLRNTQPELFPIDLRNPIFSDSQLEISTTTIIQLSHDICASVPFMLGYAQGGEVTLNSAKAVSGNLLLWPLYTAACTSLVSDMMCHWVAGRLRVISDIMGIKQAAPLSHILTKRKDLLAWELEDIKKGAAPNYEDWTHGQLMELT
ncbi:putative c6 finger domain protein [Botrytis cinerea BcDW1]|uniref:Putative c6 finger domain protein n=1 Tax=Botryotinia fuckeliana (strain BcDW1) TaxID=1290391 RepID=M7TYQ2_BOTF1|nr:putative c6 finger domain protein [Botrytis cinerea BcDW1]